MDDGRLFEALHPALRRFAAVVRPPGVDADDLLQEALARTLRRTTLAELDEPLVYLRRVVFNLAASHRRSMARRAAIDVRRGGGDPTTTDVHSSDLADLLAVPVDQRAVLYLHLVEGSSHDEIAEMLGISATASRARLSRGLRRLRVELADQEVAP